MTKEQKIKIIVGATAVGKTGWSINYAQNNNAEIISADSMQIYKYMNIGTAKPTLKEQSQAKHHLIDFVEPDQEYSAYNFVEQTNKLITEIRKKNKEPIIAGGTGLYVNAFIRDFAFPKVPQDKELRQQLKKEASEKGLSTLYERLKKILPETSDKITENDEYRIVRALEVYELTGKPITEFHQTKKEYRDDFEIIWLDRERTEIYNRINKRVEVMIEQGLFNEVEFLLLKGYDTSLPAIKALGYKEVIEYINNQITKEDCIEKIKKKTRNFAKRQITWFRSFPVQKHIYLKEDL